MTAKKVAPKVTPSLVKTNLLGQAQADLEAAAKVLRSTQDKFTASQVALREAEEKYEMARVAMAQAIDAVTTQTKVSPIAAR